MKPKKVKKCKICKTEFMPYSSLTKVCSPKCALELVELDKQRKNRKDLVEYRKQNKSLSKWIDEAQVAINAYVRIRDFGKPCISCGNMYAYDSGQWDAGHFRSRGSAPHLRFNLLNNHRQCKYCNRHLGGNYSEYRKGLIDRIGLEKVETLENSNGYKKFDRHYCEKVKRIFKEKTRRKKKLLGIK